MAAAAPAMTRMTRFPAVSRFSTVAIRASSVSMPLSWTDTRRPSTFTDIPGPMPAGTRSSTRPASRSTVALKSVEGKPRVEMMAGGAGEHGRAEIDCDDTGARSPGSDPRTSAPPPARHVRSG